MRVLLHLARQPRRVRATHPPRDPPHTLPPNWARPRHEQPPPQGVQNTSTNGAPSPERLAESVLTDSDDSD